MFTHNSELDQKAINAIRILSADAVQKANSGHPGKPLGSAPMAYTLFSKQLKHNPADPNWINRDRFVLSAGHASMLLYSLLYLYGYGLTKDDLMNFRQFDSKTPGHPEYGVTKGVETTTGPLGQGVSTAVGLALAEAHLASRFNKEGHDVFDHYTFALVGDGCLQEGVSSEACSLAGTLGLGKLIVLYDDNEISIEGDTDLSFQEDVLARYKAYGWQTIDVADGNDTAAINQAIADAKANTDQPTIIAIHTQIGYGSPLAGSEKTHGAPLGAENITKLREYLEWDLTEAFATPEDLDQYMADQKSALAEHQNTWKDKLAAYAAAYPDDYKKFQDLEAGKTPDLINDEEFWKFEGSVATRKTSEVCINRIAERFDNWIGGSADLAGSTLTEQKGKAWISKDDYSGRNIHFGVREFGMACIANGLALHSGLRPYCATFLIFSDYLKPALRLTALMEIPVTFVFTHDSIGVGEDGATHEPIEQLDTLRAVPGLYTWRPADGHETAAAYAFALNQRKPVALALSRQNLPTFEETGKSALKGAYVLSDNSKDAPDVILIATGSEVEIIAKAAETLRAEGRGVRVVSMPCMELFLEQDKAYQEEILPKAVRSRVAVEAASTQPWYRFVGLDGAVVGLDHFGGSAPGNVLYEKFGLTAEKVVEKANAVVSQNGSGKASGSLNW